jgi:AcrR family transcriptional regulator
MIQPRYDPVNRYESLLRAGEELFIRGGYEEAHPLRIAQLAEVSVGLFYKHFANKRSLLAAIVEQHLGKMHTAIASDVAECLDPVSAFRRVLLLTLQYFQEHQGLIRLFFMEIGYGDETASAQLHGARQNYRAILSAILRDGSEQGVFLKVDELDIDLSLNSIVGTINWTLYDLLVVRGETLDAEILAKRLSALLLRSLCPYEPKH